MDMDMEKYKDMGKEELLDELEQVIVQLSDSEKTREDLENIIEKLSYRLNVLKATIKNMVDKI